MRRLLLALVIALSVTGCNRVTVTVAAPSSLHSGQPGTVTGSATTKQGMNPAPAGPMNFTVTAGTIAPSPVTTDVAGNASSTFTAPVVDRQTVVTVTAKHSGESGTADITVNPAIGLCQFPAIGINPIDPADSVSIAPVVTELPNGSWQWVYTLTSGGAIAGGGGIRTVSVSFDAPVNLTSTSGSVTPTPGPSANYAIGNSPALPLTITVTGDAQPGGVAKWDIIDTPPNIRHAQCTTTGPTP